MIVADVNILHQTKNYRIANYTCHCDTCSVSGPEYNDAFSMSFVQKGYFGYKTFRREDDMHTGRVLLSKAGFEHITTHIDQQPDVTTVFEFTVSFFEEIQAQYKSAHWFLSNHDVHSVVLISGAEEEYLHHAIRDRLGKGHCDTLLIDEMVCQLLDTVLSKLGSEQPATSLPLNIINHHLPTIERAKEYLLEHFRQDISLETLAGYCFVSPFHFSRIFKSVLTMAPHKYLLSIRLQNALHTLMNTQLPITEIAFDCGFNSLEHFVTAFKQQYRQTPSAYRASLV